MNRKDVLACLALVLLATLAFGDVFAGINNFYIRDLTRYYYPTKQILSEIVYGGEFPYWNRYFSAGQPIAANPEHEVFYPFTWLILLPSYDFGYRMHILVHIWIALVGMYALLRSMELRIEAALFGAFVWGLGGLFMSYVNLLPILFCAAWLPLTCLFARRFLLDPNRRDFALAALFLGMQFLVSEPTTVAQTGLLLGMYALYRAWYARPRITKAITRLFWIGLISAAGFLVGFVQVLPALDHVRDSARSRPFGFDLVSAWSMPWAKFAELIYSNILGHTSIKNVTWYWGGGLYPGMGSAFLFSIYCGILVIALVVGAAFARPRGGRFVLIVCVVSTLLALGGNTPLLKFLYNIGLAKSIRYPEKFVMMGIFALIIFAAQMFDLLLAGDEALREGAIGFTLAAFTVALIIAIVGFTPLYGRVMTKIWMLSGANAKTIITTSAHDWIWAALRCGAALLLLVTVRTRHRAALSALLLRRSARDHSRPRRLRQQIVERQLQRARRLRDAAELRARQRRRARRARDRQSRRDRRRQRRPDLSGHERHAAQVLADHHRRPSRAGHRHEHRLSRRDRDAGASPHRDALRQSAHPGRRRRFGGDGHSAARAGDPPAPPAPAGDGDAGV